MKTLILFALVGFGAQLVDGSLGMGYGVTSSSLLLAAGLTPAAASASVHLSEVGTTLVSGVSHWRLRNVDWRLVLRLGVPGAVGAFLGATVLSKLSTEAAEPVMAMLLAGLGVYILLRFALKSGKPSVVRRSPHTKKFLIPLGLVGGFVDATGGGGWGPVSTSSLLSAGKTAPRTVIGSVDTSEFMVTVAASLGFLFSLGTAGIDWTFALLLLGGGVLAAPLAAWLVSRVPSGILGAAVGGLILLTNLKTLFGAINLEGTGALIGYGLVVLAWIGALTLAIVRLRAAKKAGTAEDAARSDIDDEKVQTSGAVR